MLFLAFSNTNFQFDAEKLTWRSYTTTEALFTTSWVEIINKKEFAKTTLDKNSKTFIVHITALEVLIVISIHLSRAFQVQDNFTLTALKWNKALIKISA